MNTTLAVSTASSPLAAILAPGFGPAQAHRPAPARRRRPARRTRLSLRFAVRALRLSPA